jgi:large subunit ribosomal protein L9
MAEFKIIKADLEAKEMTMIKAATEKAESMTEVVCTLKANASEEGKLFGSVTTADIVASLADLGHEVEKRNINLSEAGERCCKNLLLPTHLPLHPKPRYVVTNLQARIAPIQWNLAVF